MKVFIYLFTLIRLIKSSTTRITADFEPVSAQDNQYLVFSGVYNNTHLLARSGRRNLSWKTTIEDPSPIAPKGVKWLQPWHCGNSCIPMMSNWNVQA